MCCDRQEIRTFHYSKAKTQSQNSIFNKVVKDLTSMILYHNVLRTSYWLKSKRLQNLRACTFKTNDNSHFLLPTGKHPLNDLLRLVFDLKKFTACNFLVLVTYYTVTLFVKQMRSSPGLPMSKIWLQAKIVKTDYMTFHP